MRHKNRDYEHPRAAYMPRTRGALSGLLPFLRPYRGRIALATVFLHERPSPLQWLGIGLALAGGAMLSYETAPVAAPEEQLPCAR